MCALSETKGMKLNMRKKLLRILFILLVIYILYSGFKLLIIEHTLTYKINNYKVEEVTNEYCKMSVELTENAINPNATSATK